jgi:hypothetical protein
MMRDRPKGLVDELTTMVVIVARWKPHHKTDSAGESITGVGDQRRGRRAIFAPAGCITPPLGLARISMQNP